jgi:hypothetical protein
VQTLAGIGRSGFLLSCFGDPGTCSLPTMLFAASAAHLHALFLYLPTNLYEHGYSSASSTLISQLWWRLISLRTTTAPAWKAPENDEWASSPMSAIHGQRYAFITLSPVHGCLGTKSTYRDPDDLILIRRKQAPQPDLRGKRTDLLGAMTWPLMTKARPLSLSGWRQTNCIKRLSASLVGCG